MYSGHIIVISIIISSRPLYLQIAKDMLIGVEVNIGFCVLLFIVSGQTSCFSGWITPPPITGCCFVHFIWVLYLGPFLIAKTFFTPV